MTMLEADYTFFSSSHWKYKGKTGNDLEIYEHKESGSINIYDPLTGDIVED